uniref:Uncharacterized protein n=1 Tax=Ixodes ricinus TaxID=34613 RepID=A0A6B0UXV1_IXORI
MGKKSQTKKSDANKTENTFDFFLNLSTLLYSISAFISIKNLLNCFIEKEETTPQSRVLFQSLHLAVPHTRNDSEFQFHETNTHILYIFIQIRPLITIEIVRTIKFIRNYCVQRAIILRTSDPKKSSCSHRPLGTLFTLFFYGTICSSLFPFISISLSYIYS